MMMTTNGWANDTEEIEERLALIEQPCGYRLANSLDRIARGLVTLARSRQAIQQSQRRYE